MKGSPCQGKRGSLGAARHSGMSSEDIDADLFVLDYEEVIEEDFPIIGTNLFQNVGNAFFKVQVLLLWLKTRRG